MTEVSLFLCAYSKTAEPGHGGIFPQKILDGLLVVLDEGLLDQAYFLVELVDAALHDFFGDLGGLAFFLGLAQVDFPLLDQSNPGKFIIIRSYF